MNSPIYLIIILPILFISCSTYQKVTISNFTEYEITSDEKEDLHYVLKKHKLHYSDIDWKENSNFYTVDGSTPYHSRSAVYEENIVIPRGATGRCIHSQDDQFTIDFGEGIHITFLVLNDDNRASAKIEVDGRIYSIAGSNQEASLFFDTRGLSGSYPMHSDEY